MPAHYDINLIQDEVALQRRKRQQVRFMATAILLLVTIQSLVLIAYLRQSKQLARDYQLVQELLSRATQLTEAQSTRLDKLWTGNRDLRDQLLLLEETTAGAIPWSRVLQSLAESCGTKPIKIQRLVARAGQDGLKLQIEAVCTAERPVGHIRTFINGLQEHQAFSNSNLLSLQGMQEQSRQFRVETQLQANHFQQPESTQPRQYVQADPNSTLHAAAPESLIQ